MTQKIFFFLMVLILIFSSILGCISENENIKYATSKDLSLKISMDKTIFKENETNYINVSIVLKNIGKNKIRFKNNFFIGGGLHFRINNSDGDIFINDGPYKKRVLSEKILKPDEEMKITINLIEIPIKTQSGTSISDWTYPGTYSIQFVYKSIEPNLESNTIQFKIEG